MLGQLGQRLLRGCVRQAAEGCVHIVPVHVSNFDQGGHVGGRDQVGVHLGKGLQAVEDRMGQAPVCAAAEPGEG